MGDILELVVGAFGEASTDLERVIVAVAESRVLYLSRETGRPVTDLWWLASTAATSQCCLSRYRQPACCLGLVTLARGEGR